MPAWDGDIPAARQLQDNLARQLVLRDDFAKPLRTIAFDATTSAQAALHMPVPVSVRPAG